MTNTMRNILAGAASLLLLCGGSARAQRWVNPHFDTHRMDIRDLGYPTQNLIPADNGCISALLAHSNGFIYGATSGRTQSYLFFYNRFINKVRPLGKISDAPLVNPLHHLHCTKRLFANTGKQSFQP